MAVTLTARAEPIPGYFLIERLGRGGFGEVWKCEAPGGMFKAIKLVYGNLDEAGDEGKAAEQEKKSLERIKQIRHPFLLSLERYDVIDGQLIIVMELADRSLWDRFRDCRTENLVGIPREELLGYLTEAAEALDMINQEHNLQHLDVKPQNLFLTHNHVKVADFGLVKAFEGMSASVTGGVTPVYAAPETFDDRVTRFSDQYSLAIVYQELLTGKRPFNGSNTRQLILQHLTHPPDLTPLPECDRGAVGRALAKKPDERFPSCSSFVASLRAQGNGTATAIPEARSGPPTTTPGPANGLAPSTVNGAASIARGPLPAPPSLNKVPRPSQLISRPTRDPSSTQSLGPAVATMPRPAGVAVSAPLASLPAAPSERVGDGALLPAVVIGVGNVGGRVVRQLRKAVQDQFGATDAVPHLRFLTVDTDPEAAGRSGVRDLILARLHRPSHYLTKSRDGGGLEWLPAGLLYRLPRNPVTTGLRGLGRLAFLDYARQIEQRLDAELKAVLDPAALADADRRTGLRVRTNRPRVYVVTTPAGGTGGGMFIDLAYLARHALRKLGHAQPDVVGVLMVPPGDKAGSRTAVANTYASLTELAHYSRPDTTYEARFNPRDPAVVDRGRPFGRCLVLPLPVTNDPNVRRQAVGLASGLVFRELLAPLGRAADVARPAADAATFFQTVGTYRLAWPGRRLARRAARHLAADLLRDWTAKERGGVRDAITTWLDEQWDARQLRPELLIDRIQAIGEAAMGMAPDAKFESLLAPLFDRSTLGSQYDARAAATVLTTVTDLVGRPAYGEDPPPGQLQRALELAGRGLSAEYDQKLAELAVHFIELPRHRLAAAEEAVRQITDRLTQAVESYDTLSKSLNREATAIYARLLPLIGTLEAKRSAPPAEIGDLLRSFPKKRYQALLAGMVLSMYRSMVASAPEYLREVNFCRQRLTEAMALLNPAGESGVPSTLGPGRDLYAGGKRSADEAAGDLVAGLSADELLEFDNRVQTQVRAQFRAVVNVCLESNGPPAPLADLVRGQAEEFLDARLGNASAAEAVFEAFAADPQGAHRAVAEAYDEAEPTIDVEAGTRVDVLAVPPGAGGTEFRRLVAEAVPGADLKPADSPDEVVFYRERAGLAVTDLPQFGPAAKATYDAVRDGEFIPHTRGDVTWRPPPAPAEATPRR